jgi:gliding motility-associated lipoprotein GldH
MRSILFVCLLYFIAIGCNSNTVVGDMQAIKGNTWPVDAPVSFTLPALDSAAVYTAYITIRNNNDYPFSNLFLLAALQHPNGKTVVDTLEYKMAKPDGSWLGTGIGAVKENKLYYKENFKFEEAGEYTLRLIHAVRNNGEVQGVTALQGITDVGYSIELAN